MLDSQTSPQDYSEEFYRRNAKRYSEVSHQLLQSIYIESSH